MHKLNLNRYEVETLYLLLNAHLNLIGTNSLHLFKGKPFAKKSELREYLLSLEDLESRLASLLNKQIICEKENIKI